MSEDNTGPNGNDNTDTRKITAAMNVLSKVKTGTNGLNLSSIEETWVGSTGDKNNIER